jgi:hypothetical protein
MSLSWAQRCKPAVGRPVLLLLSGLMWSSVGTLLIRLSGRRLQGEHWTFVLLGVALVWPLYRLIFARLLKRNLARLSIMQDRVCILAFQSGRVYLLVVVMMGLAIGLRYTGLPDAWLGSLYLAIGGGKLLSGLAYFALLTGSL